MGSLSTGRTRVLMLLDRLSGGGGGAEVFTVGLASSLPRDRFDVRVCAVREADGFLLELLDDAGIPRFCLQRDGRDLRPFRRLHRYLREECVDVLHTHMFGSNVWGTVVGRLARTPVIVAQEHTWSYQGQPLRKLLDGQLIGRFASRFVAVSRADRERMVALERVRPEKTAVIPAAFVPRDLPPAGDARAELGIPAEAPVVGTAVSMRPQKALEVLIDAFARLLEALPDARLLLVGDGVCREELEAHARRRGVDGRVHFTGNRPDVLNFIAAFDVSALSSDFEGTPLFVFESMALGTPVVATAVGGLLEVIEDGRSGVLVPPRDPEALASALEDLLRDPARREAIAAAGRERVREFSVERAAERFAGLYEELLR
jgi:glycosyltransferase involved in cell wall biosynthesis